MTADATDRGRQAHRLISAVLVLGSLLTGLSFAGVGVNLLLLLATAALLMTAVSSTGMAAYANLWRASPADLLAPASLLAALTFACQSSLSADHSFAPTWVLAAGPVAFLAVRAIADDRPARLLLSRGFLGIALALAAYAVFRSVAFGETAHRPLPDPNNFASLMYLAWIPLVHWHLWRYWRGDFHGERRYSLYLASFLLLAALVASGSRASLLIVCVAFVVWCIAGLARGRWQSPLGGHLLCLAAAFGVVVLTSGAGWSQSLTAESVGGGAGARLDLIHSSWSMFTDRPLTGVGVFCFSLLYPMYRSLSEQETVGLFVHNDYLQLLTEGGPLLLLVVIGCLSPLVVQTLRLILVRPDDDRFGRLGLGLALCAVLAHASINFVFYTVSLSVVIGAMAAVFRNGPMAPEALRVTATPAPMKAAALAALLFGWTSWGYLLIDTAVVGVLQGQRMPFVSAIRQSEDSVLRFSRAVQRLNGERGMPVLAEAAILHERLRRGPDSELLSMVVDRYRAARSADPWNPLVYMRMASFVQEHPDISDPFGSGETAESLLLSAVSLDPFFAPALRELMNYYEGTAQLEKRRLFIEQVVFQRLPLLKQRGADALVGDVLGELRALAIDGQDSQLSTALAAMDLRLSAINPRNQGWGYL